MRLDANASGAAHGVYGELVSNKSGLSLGVSAAGDLVIGDLNGSLIKVPCFPALEWHFVVGVISDNSTLQLYVDNVLSNTIPFTLSRSCDFFTIGAWTQNSTFRPFLGRLDELRLFATSLTVPDMDSAMMKNTIFTVFPVFYFTMEGQLRDSVSNSPIAANSTFGSPNVSLNVIAGGVCFQPTPPTPSPTTSRPTTTFPTRSPVTEAPTMAPSTVAPTTNAPTFITITNVLKVYGSATDPKNLIALPLTSLGETGLEMKLPPYFAFTLDCVSGSHFTCENEAISVQTTDIVDLNGQLVTSIGKDIVPLTFRNRYNATMITVGDQFDSDHDADVQFEWKLEQEQLCPVSFWFFFVLLT